MVWQQGCPALAGQVISRRSGSGLDPAPVKAFLGLAEEAFAGMAAPSVWDAAMAAEPGPHLARDCTVSTAPRATPPSARRPQRSRDLHLLASFSGGAV